MSERVTVRRATGNDVDAIRRVAERTWYETYDGILDEETIASLLAAGYSSELLEARVGSDDAGLFVATVDDEVVGYASTIPLAEDGVGEMDVYVRPDRWGEGVGTRLLARAETHLAERGVGEIRDAVLASNGPGNAFYGSRFEKVGERTVEIGGVDHVANVYERSIE
ncbi:GNAT family N-acetyltransferase [Natronorarus salvus]|uniref:GNAT family N-acetyltransferase n=1 Tax=Natronorarus salvus TaxID=3117733 RepID=UPI002F2670B0